MDVRNHLKQNVEHFHDVLRDLNNWEKEMKRKEDALKSSQTNTTEELPAVRTKLLKSDSIVAVDNKIPAMIEIDEENREKSLVEKELGNEFVKQQKWLDAIHHYSEAINYFSADAKYYANRAQCYLQTMQWTAAKDDCTSALKIDPCYVKAYHRRALALKELNCIQEAIDDLTKALQFEPNNATLRDDLTRLKNVSVSSTKSEENAESNSQKREESLFEKERGNELVKKKKWEEAIHCYTKAIACYSKDATFYCNRALCYLKIKRFKEAETDCTIALQLDPEYTKAYHRRACALKEMKQLKEACDDLQKALKFEPNNSQIKNDLTSLEKTIGHCASTEVINFNLPIKSKESDKNLAYANKEKGNAFVKKRNYATAIECYTEACSLYPEEASFYLNRALCFLRTNQPEKAVLDCIRALELDPNNSKAFYRRGLAYKALKEFRKAHDDLLAAFKLDSADTAIQKELVKVEKSLGLIPQHDEPSTERHDNDTESNSSKKRRISGERFIKLGGRIVQPVKKSYHQLSNEPLKRVKIVDKKEIILSTALDELNEVETNGESRHIGENSSESIPKTTQADASTKLIPIEILPPPKTSIQFVSSWNELANTESQYRYLKRIKGEDLPNIFLEALESWMFSDILEILAVEFTKRNDPVRAFLYGLSKVRRFSALLLFMTEEDNANVRALLDYARNVNEITAAERESLARLYCCQ